MRYIDIEKLQYLVGKAERNDLILFKEIMDLKDLTLEEKVVLAELKDDEIFSGHKFYFHQKFLAEKLGISRNKMSKIKKRLEELGYIEMEDLRSGCTTIQVE